MKYRDTYRIVTQVSRYVSHRDFRYRATPIERITVLAIIEEFPIYQISSHYSYFKTYSVKIVFKTIIIKILLSFFQNRVIITPNCCGLSYSVLLRILVDSIIGSSLSI